MTKQIPLTQGLFATVDDADYDFLMQWKWCAHKIGDRIYAERASGRHRMHRDIMNPGQNEEVDHRRGNGLNNTRDNLRLCTHPQNQHNRGKRKNNTSGFKGVHKNKNRWSASITANGTVFHLGTFDTPEEAAKAYDVAAKEHHGDFALLNFTT